MTGLDKVLNDLKKTIGKALVLSTEKIPKIKLSSPKLNYVLGGGLAEGRILELYGVESSGKSLIAQIIGGDIQKATNKFVHYQDQERTFDPEFANKFGLSTDPKNFVKVCVDSGEQAFTATQKLIESDQVALSIIDSVSNMVAEAELEGEMEDAHMGVQARMMGKGLRKITHLLDKHNVSIIFINQIRSKIGGYGNPNTTSGGNALKFYSSCRLEFLKAEDILKDKELIGIKVRIKNTKSKIGPSKRRVEVDIYFDKGLDVVKEYVELAKEYEILEKAGSWYTVTNGERFQGLDKVVEFFRENESEYNIIKDKVDRKLFPEDFEEKKEVKKEKPKKRKTKKEKEEETNIILEGE